VSNLHPDFALQVLGAKFLTAARSSLSMSGAGASQELQQLAQDASEPLLGLGAPCASQRSVQRFHCHDLVATLEFGMFKKYG
jgi:hypothetical protein